MRLTDPATIPGRLCAAKDADPRDWDTPERMQIHPATARRLCHGCPAKSECLEYALAMERGVPASGRGSIYGGTTPRERAAMDKAKRAAA